MEPLATRSISVACKRDRRDKSKVGAARLLPGETERSRCAPRAYSIALPKRALRSSSRRLLAMYLLSGSLRCGLEQRGARAAVVAAQHVGIALVVQDLRRRPDDADRLRIGAVGEIEAAQPVVGGGQARARPRRRADAVRPRGGNGARPGRNCGRGTVSCRAIDRRWDRCRAGPLGLGRHAERRRRSDRRKPWRRCRPARAWPMRLVGVAELAEPKG